MKLCLPAVSAAALLAMSGAAFAGPGPTVFSFNYQNLSGSYSTGTSTFAAVAAAGPSQINSVGSVTRTAPPGGTANFGAGFVAGADPSDFQMSLNVSDISGFLASGFGTFTATDIHGDTLTGNISGSRFLGLGFAQIGVNVNFFGELSNVVFTPFPASGNTTFDGSSSGAFNFTTIPGGPSYNGAIVELFLNSSGSPFTSFDWGYIPGQRDPVPVGINAELVPAPGAAALLGLGGLVTARRRRR